MSFVAEGDIFGGRYRIEEKLGEGGMARVFRARCLNGGGDVAIKLLFPHLANEPKVRQRFFNEARIQSQLVHPNIAHVRELIDERGLVGFVMDWCDGGDLRAWMRESGQAPSRERWRSLYLPILQAMGTAHEQGFVHRDLKPSNILLRHGAEGLEPLVSDFGIAKILGVKGRTRTGAWMGTLSYMSPEQVQDSKQVDHRSDIYSLGVILYELATGRLPFSEGGPSVLLQIFREPPSPPKEAPKVLQPIIERCLEKSPERRFESCAALYDAMERALEREGRQTWVQAQYPAQRRCASETDATAPLEDVDTLLPWAGESGDALSETLPPDSFLEAPPPLTQGGMRGPHAALDSFGQEVSEAAKGGDSFGEASVPSVSLSAENAWARDKQSWERPIPDLEALEALEADFVERDAAYAKTKKNPTSSGSRRVAGWVFLSLLLLGAGVVLAWGPYGWLSRWKHMFWSEGNLAAPTQDAGSKAQQPLMLHLGPPLESGTLLHERQGNLLHKPPAKRISTHAPLSRASQGRRSLPVRRPLLVQTRLLARRLFAPRRRLPKRSSPLRCPDAHPTLCMLWMRCQKSQPKGCFEYALRYYQGEDVRKNDTIAHQFFRRACVMNFGRACAAVGVMVYFGQGVRQDRPLAQRLFQRGCQLGSMRGCTELGAMMSAKRRYAEANKLYVTACMRRYGRACTLLGYSYEHGLGVRKSLRQAHFFYQRACQAKHAAGCTSLGYNYLYGRGSRRGIARANYFFLRACRLGDGRGCWWIGRHAYLGIGMPRDHRLAVRYLSRACSLKHGWGCRSLGVMHELGRGFAVSPPQAKAAYRQANALFQRGCRAGVGLQCFWLGGMYAKGLGVRASCKHANLLYQKACRLGYRKACQRFCVDRATRTLFPKPFEE